MKIAFAALLAATALAACRATPDEGGRTAPSRPMPPGAAAPREIAPAAREPAAAHAVAPPSTGAQRGGELYARMCSVCHGPSGEGYKADQAPAIGRAEYLASVPDDLLRDAMANGRVGTTMSAWSKARGGPLDRSDVDALIAFLRAWQKRPAVPLDERALGGDSGVGSNLFATECARCHGALGKLGPAVRIGDPAWLAHASNGVVRYAVREGRPGTEMPRFAEKLGDKGVEDVVAYLRRLQVQPAAAPLPPVARPAPLPLGKVPLHPGGPDPKGFRKHPETTPADVVHAELARGAKMALLDARAPPDFTAEHITGAVSVPFYDPSPYVDKLPKHAWLVCYCACPHAESGELATKLVAAGFDKVTVLQEGLGYWKNKGYGTTAATAPPSRPAPNR